MKAKILEVGLRPTTQVQVLINLDTVTMGANQSTLDRKMLGGGLGEENKSGYGTDWGGRRKCIFGWGLAIGGIEKIKVSG